MTSEDKQALIWRCRDAVAHLKQVVEVGIRGGRYSVTEYRYQLMINEIALTYLTAPPDEWQRRAEEAEAIVSDVNEVIGLLSEREWAEHCTKTETGKRLEELITELHNDAAEIEEAK